MKAHREEIVPSFKPVTLILESQEEVDGLYAFFNHGISDVVGFGDDSFKVLKPFRSDKGEDMHEEIQAYIRRTK
jgi:hypothetical protein